MKTKISIFLFLTFGCFFVVTGQTLQDSLAIVDARWSVTSLQKGIVCRQAEISFLYHAPQHVTVLEVDPKYHRLGVVVSSPKRETSVAARDADAVAAINGSYFNVKEGYSVCYLRQGRVVTDTTTAGEFKLRVTGAVEVSKKGKVKLLPWSKDIEKAYSGKNTAVLASGPLMLLSGKTSDFSMCGKKFVETKHPRSAIAVTRSGKILLMTVDGRFPGKAEGVTIPELAHLVRILGGYDALNLDGGGSSTLWSVNAPDNGVLNKLCDNRQYDHTGERKVANSIGVFKK